ncbi:MAG: TetR/AcrR family transcriptional regulator [Clostridiales bacterium]|nr:TetR/AcrR family transcriptional regulator [Clostridiales bacterium]
MNAKESKKAQSQKILKTAFECLSAKGYANVSMRDIAKEADVALSQLNYYFKNKEGLFIEVINSMSYQYLHEIEKKLNSNTNNENKLTSLVEYFKDLSYKKPELLKLFIDFTAQALWIPAFKLLLKELYEKIIEIIKNNISANNHNINSKHESSETLAQFIFGAIFGISVQILLGLDDKSSYKSLEMVEELPFLMN